MPKTKPNTWFIKVRGSYLPSSWQGWFLYIPFISYLVIAMVYACDSEESPYRILFDLITQYLLAAIVMTWIASKRSA